MSILKIFCEHFEMGCRKNFQKVLTGRREVPIILFVSEQYEYEQYKSEQYNNEPKKEREEESECHKGKIWDFRSTTCPG